MATKNEAPVRFNHESDDRSSLRKILDRYNAPIAWGVGASYLSYQSALFIVPSLAAEKLLVGCVAAVGLLTLIISALVPRRK